MRENCIKIHRWLYPIAFIYKVVTGVRNRLFDRSVLRSKSFDIPILCVGNLAVGGTGKTPHTEYLIRLLQAHGLNVATLSRGYKRKTKGYLLADVESNACQIGDEPMQMKQKFPEVRVAVDEQRCRGVERLMQLGNPPVDVILLDDAYQHRHIKAGLNILLTDCNRLFCDDALLPAGRLRESAKGRERAQIIIVTKCPDNIKPIDLNVIGKRLKLYPYQQLYFSRFRYGALRPLFGEAKEETGNLTETMITRQDEVLLVTGIASPTPLEEEIRKRTQQVKLLAFADHHDFSARELIYIKEEFLKLTEGHRLIITTEKDAVRLKEHPTLDEAVKPFIHVLPIEVEFLQEKETTFNQNIIDYVRKNTRNRIIPPREDAHKS